MKRNRALGIIAIIGACILVLGLIFSGIGIITGGWRSYVSVLNPSFVERFEIVTNHVFPIGRNNAFNSYWTGLSSKSDQFSEEITEIDLSVSFADINIELSDRNGYRIERYPTSNIDVTFVNGKLRIVDHFNWRDNWFVGNMRSYDAEITLYVTAKALENLTIESGAGDVDIEDLNILNLSVNLGAGTCDISRVTSEKADIITGAGELDFEDCDIKDLRADTGAGSFSYTGDLRGNCDLQSGAGEIVLRLYGRESDYYFSITAGVGSVVFNRSGSSGIIGDHTYGSPSAGCRISINTGVGSVDIQTR